MSSTSHGDAPDAPDDETVRVERGRDAVTRDESVTTDAGILPDESTALSSRGRTEDPGATVPAFGTTGAEETSERSAEPGPRRRDGGAGGEDPEPDDGSTMVVRRESRRRAARAEDAAAHPDAEAGEALASTSAADLPAPLDRIARAPDAESVYPPRTAEPVRAARAPAGAHPRQDPVDTAAIDASVRARERRTTLLVVAAASILLAGAITAIVLLATTA